MAAFIFFSGTIEKFHCLIKENKLSYYPPRVYIEKDALPERLFRFIAII